MDWNDFELFHALKLIKAFETRSLVMQTPKKIIPTPAFRL